MSFLCPPVKIKRIALPKASVARWIFVECPPRLLPKDCVPCFFRHRQNKRGREQWLNQSTGIPNHGQQKNARKVFQKYRVPTTGRSVYKQYSNCRNWKAKAAIASRNEWPGKQLPGSCGSHFPVRCKCSDRFLRMKEFSPIDDHWILQLTFC